MKEQVIELAKQAGASRYTNRHYPDRPTHTFTVEQLELYTKLLRNSALAPLTWQQAEQISDSPNVDEALRNFAEDQTADNAIALVQVIHEAAIRNLKEPTP